MYKAEELCGLLIKPKINDIDLDVLQDYYRKFLNPFIYQYDITENEKQSSIQLRFDEENFCHLLGIESIVKYSVSKKEIHHYKGQGGWDYIQNTGLCFNDLKRMNKSKFKSIKAKFVYFYLMPDILEIPVAVNFKNENVIEKAKEIIPTIQKFCTGFLQGNSYGISEEEYQNLQVFVIDVLKDYVAAIEQEDVCLLYTSDAADE